MSTPSPDQTSKRRPRPDQAGPAGEKHEAAPSGRKGDATETPNTRSNVLKREKNEYGGVKVGLAFFGWLTATGVTVMLTTLIAAAGTAVGVATNINAGTATSQAAHDPKTVGIAGAVILLLVLFVAYYCGGYVAGRMARFHGLRQGLAVWLWAVLIAAVVAVLAALAGSQYDVLSKLNTFPRIPVSQGNLTTGGLIALVVVAAGSLGGALLGGQAGMVFHRRVDRAGLGQ